MDHVLDNPAWNALISGNKRFFNGDEEVGFFDKDVSPFVGFKVNSTANFHKLYELIPDNEPRLFVAPTEIEIPASWKVLHFIKGLQMTYDVNIEPDKPQGEILILTDKHIPQMLALTKLTNPGPFAKKTIDFGHYYGIFEGDKLVAMAGQRLHAFEYAEISAVCTHPDYLGRGYARQLLLHQLHRMKAASYIPFLHVKHDNERAIKVYKHLGFSTRIKVYFYFMEKATLV